MLQQFCVFFPHFSFMEFLTQHTKHMVNFISIFLHETDISYEGHLILRKKKTKLKTAGRSKLYYHWLVSPRLVGYVITLVGVT